MNWLSFAHCRWRDREYLGNRSVTRTARWCRLLFQLTNSSNMQFMRYQLLSPCTHINPHNADLPPSNQRWGFWFSWFSESVSRLEDKVPNWSTFPFALPISFHSMQYSDVTIVGDYLLYRICLWACNLAVQGVINRSVGLARKLLLLIRCRYIAFHYSCKMFWRTGTAGFETWGTLEFIVK